MIATMNILGETNSRIVFPHQWLPDSTTNPLIVPMSRDRIGNAVTLGRACICPSADHDFRLDLTDWTVKN
ncbi:MAG: hypothetical protein AAF563_03685 [Pseudomonadota bacterium]